MRVESKKSNKKRIAIVIVVLLLVVGVGFAYYLYTTKPSDSSNDTKIQNKTSGSTQKEDSTDTSAGSSSDEIQTTEEPTKVEGKTPTQYEGEDFNNEPPTDNERFRIPEGE